MQLPDDIDEESELGDDDMVYVDDDECESNDSSIYGLGQAELEAEDDEYKDD